MAELDIKLGESFNTFGEFEARITNRRNALNEEWVIGKSVHSVSYANKRIADAGKSYFRWPDRLKYTSCMFQCIHYGTFCPVGKKRKPRSKKKECPVFVKINANKTALALRVTDVNLQHNHALTSKEVNQDGDLLESEENMKFTIEIYEKLIELVKANPCIYDSSLPQYRDTQLQQQVWRKITKAMDEPSMTWEEWRKAWRQKRDAFTRKRRELETLSTESAVQEIRKNPLYEAMTFLIGQTDNKRRSRPIYLSQLSQGSSHSEGEESTTYHSNDTARGDIKPDADMLIEEPGSPRSCHSDAPSASRENFSVRKRRSEFGGHGHHDGKSRKGRRGLRQGQGHYDEMLMLQQLNETEASSWNTLETIQHIVRETLGEEKQTDIYSFLSSKMQEFSKSTQDWMEDEVLKLYLEAKRREREIETQ